MHTFCQLISKVQIVGGLKLVLHGRRNFAARAYVHRTGDEPLVYRNLGQQVLRAAEKFADRVALVSCHENERLTFKEAKDEAVILAVHLQILGLRSGDHLGIWATNTKQWYISFLAAALGGFPLVCMNPALQAEEIAYALSMAKVKALITMDACGKQNFHAILKTLLPNVTSGAQSITDKNFPALQRVLMKSNAAVTEFLNYDNILLEKPPTHDVAYMQLRVPQISVESPCNIQFTSGTTGKPKAAILSHFNYVNDGHYFGKALQLQKKHANICLTVPMFHAFGIVSIISALEYGATLVVPSENFNAAATLDAIETERCHAVQGTPTMYVYMLEQQTKRQRDLQTLEIGLVGGATCAPEVYMRIKGVLGLKDFRIGYGLSEATAAICAHDGSEDDLYAVRSVGQLFEHCEAKVINERGETVAFGEPGELCLRGFITMHGYYEDEAKTKEVLGSDGWLRTGDEFILEPTGLLRIIGRKKDMIIRGGENIYPKEIEDYLNTHADILEAQIVGIPDKRMGEELCAFLRLRAGAVLLTEEDIRKFCHGRLAHFKIPRYVRVLEHFPMTSSGKIQKFKLKQMFN